MESLDFRRIPSILHWETLELRRRNFDTSIKCVQQHTESGSSFTTNRRTKINDSSSPTLKNRICNYQANSNLFKQEF